MKIFSRKDKPANPEKIPDFVIGIGAMTKRIYAGKAKKRKDGGMEWTAKCDVTDEAVFCVASLIKETGGIILKDENGTPVYQMFMRSIPRKVTDGEHVESDEEILERLAGPSADADPLQGEEETHS